MTDEPIREDAYARVDGLDINETDQVLRNVSTKRLIKVRVKRIDPPAGQPFGVAVFEVSGSHVDEEGRALAWGEGYRIAPAQRMTVQTDRPVDIGVMLDIKRREVAAATERAVAMEEALLGRGA